MKLSISASESTELWRYINQSISNVLYIVQYWYMFMFILKSCLRAAVVANWSLTELMLLWVLDRWICSIS